MKKILIILSLIALFKGSNAQITDTTSQIFNYVEQMPEPGYDLNKYISEHIQYPDSAVQQNIQGRVILKFIVNEDGSITNCKVEKGIGGGCDEEALRVVKEMPKWKAGKKGGVPVKVKYNIPVAFALEDKEKMPTPTFDLNDYLIKNIKYPEIARDNGLQGLVKVQFVINEDGSINDCTIKKGICKLLNDEAIRIVKSMPKWSPAIQNGNPVKVHFTLPINFRLEGLGKSGIKLNKPSDYIFTFNFDEPDENPKAEYDYEKYFEENIKYPDSARIKNIQGEVGLIFNVYNDGSIHDCEVIKSLGGICDSEAIRIVKNMPKWRPGVYDKKPINAESLVYVPFYSSKEEKILATSKRIYTYADKLPKCSYDVYRYFSQNIKYPTSAKGKKIDGYVNIRFVVTENGSIENPIVLKKLGEGYDEEAIRVVKNMPNWIPGEVKGKPAKVYATLPVYFRR